MAHAVHTCATFGTMLELGVQAVFFPGGRMGADRAVLRDFFTVLGFEGSCADAARVVPIGHHGLYGLGFRLRLLKSFLEKPDVVHASSVKEACLALRLRRLCRGGFPVGFEIHHLMSMQKSGKQAMRWLALEREAFAGVDTVIFISGELKKMCAERGLDPVDSLILPNGYNDKTIRPLPIKLEKSDKTFTLAYLGSLQSGKGVENLLAAVKLLPPEFQLLVIGGKPESGLAALKKQATDLGIGERVRFAGQVAQMQCGALLSDCDAFVVPLDTDKNFFSPIKVFEALGFGLPIIATPMPTLREHLSDGKNAVFADSCAPAALADAVLRLSGTPGLVRYMRENNVQRSPMHSNTVRVRTLLAHYQGLLSVR